MLECDSKMVGLSAIYPFSRLHLIGKCFSFSLVSWIRRHSKFCEVNILCSVKWIFCTVIILSSVQSLIYIILDALKRNDFSMSCNPEWGLFHPSTVMNYCRLSTALVSRCPSAPQHLCSIFVYRWCLNQQFQGFRSFFFHRRFLPVFLWLSSWFPWTGARMFSEPGNSAQWDIERHHSTSIICFDCTSC